MNDQQLSIPQEGGYAFYIDGKYIRSNSVESLYKMLSRIELQLSDRCDKTIRRLMDEAREVLKNAEQ